MVAELLSIDDSIRRLSVCLLLREHGIECRDDAGRLLALEVWTINGRTESAWVDASSWDEAAALRWLNY